MTRAYSAIIRVHLKLALREKNVLFFNYVFPLIFFFGFGQFMGSGGMMTRVVAMVLVIGILGSGLFGAGLRAVLDRETNILRRYKVTPIGPLPLLVASMVTGWLLYLPSAVIVLLLSHFVYRMPWPADVVSLFALLTLGCFAFRAIGLIVASIANSMAEANVMIQLLYMPMLFLSGATIPVSSMPVPAQIVSQFLPASYLHTGMQKVLLGGESLASNPEAIGALLASAAVALWISIRLFRWEKEEKIPARSKAWVAAAFLPFLLLGSYQAWSREHIGEAKSLDRRIRRKVARLIRDARIFTGNGAVVERASILIHDGRIQRIFTASTPDADSLDADPIEAAGKTVLPALNDPRVLLTGDLRRAAAAYLYCGVAVVGHSGTLTPAMQLARNAIASGVTLGAAISVSPNTGVAPSLSAIEAANEAHARRFQFLDRTLVQQVAAPDSLSEIRRLFSPPPADLPAAMQALLRDWQAARPLVPATEGFPVPGPAIHRELQLWVKAGIPAGAALQAATHGSATLLGLGRQTGLIQPGYDATLLIIDGNPLEDIAATERISAVFLQGERIDRQGLFSQK